MKHKWNPKEVSDHEMVTVKIDFEMIEGSQGTFKCPSELCLDISYQHIIHSMILIESQPESEEKQ